ncbi:ABC transporter [Carpediemonas membranifera]|uniref:ABC transporter n=1 Tax=Carpediemonas membranifera TaxID=201153 RepID=A0A8J6AUZ6_9EUKA|nr:ABC transporter [Carpediemonas membranifera]|eukprot:KAG9392235.1 ABC transporter [Carpediemonas membranifera]
MVESTKNDAIVASAPGNAEKQPHGSDNSPSGASPSDDSVKKPKKAPERPINPAFNAGLLPLFTFSYLSSFFRTVRKQEVTIADIALPLSKYRTSVVYRRLYRGFKRSRVLTFGRIPKHMAISRAIFFDLAIPVYIGILLVLVSVISQYTYTVAIAPFTSVLEGSMDLIPSIVVVAVMIIAPFIYAVSATHAMTLTMRVGRSVEVAVKSLIYSKLGRLSAGLQAAVSSGKLIQLAMTDVQAIQMFFQQLQNLITVPLSLSVNFAIMWYTLGIVPTLLAFAVLIFVTVMMLGSTFLIFTGFMAKMKTAGERVKWITEVLNGMQTIKVQAWEDSFSSLVGKLRARELRALFLTLMAFVLQTTLAFNLPILVVFVTTAGYILMGNSIDTGKVYTTVSLAFALQGPCQSLPQAINAFVQSMTAIKRVQAFLRLPEIPELTNEQLKAGDVILDGSFAWLWKTDTVPKVLQDRRAQKAAKKAKAASKAASKKGSNVASGARTPAEGSAPAGLRGKERGNFRLQIPAAIPIPGGSRVHISGPVASGKSALVHAILGEMRPITLTPSLEDAYAFDPLDSTQGMYNGTLSYCSQDPWLTTKSIRDNIVMHEPWDEDRYRSVLFAACLGPDLEVLDHKDMTLVGEHGLTLSGGQKARVNLARCLYRKADVYVIDDPLAAVDAHVCEHIITHALGTFLADKTVLVASHRDVPADMQITITREHVVEVNKTFESRSLEPVEPDLASLDNLIQDAANTGDNTHTIETSAMTVSWRTYWRLIKYAGGPLAFFTVLIVLIFAQLSFNGVSYWLAFWTALPDVMSEWVFLAGVAAIGAAAVCLMFFRSLSIITMTLRVALKIHQNLVKHVLQAPMSFFETTPVGRIVNRFSTDIGLVDLSLQLNLMFTFVLVAAILFNLISMSVVLPGIIVIVIPVLIVYFILMRTVKSPFIQLRRLQGSSNSPVVSHFSETIGGITTIRAHGDFRNNFHAAQDRMDDFLVPAHAFIDCQGYLFLRTQMLGAVLSSGVVIVAILLSHWISPSICLLAVTQLYGVSQLLTFLVLCYINLESDLASFERVCEYTDSLPSEGGPTTAPPASWPEDGSLHIDNLSYRYRPNLPLALKDVSVDIHSGSKIGIVGRSGAGKSTFIAALLRLAQPEPGSKVVIGGMDAADVPINALRKAIAIIPQSPVLFSGKLRMNLDPFNRYADDKLFEVLNSVMLEKYADKEGLAHQVIQGGSNLSVGERQLVCLARALLQQSRIILIDEATASVDFATDEILQRTLRTSTVGATAIVVAHRLETIADSDLIMLIDDGKLAECGQPKTLLEDDTGKFTSLVKRANAGKAFGMEVEDSAEALGDAGVTVGLDEASFDEKKEE